MGITREEIIKGLNSVNEECGKHLGEGFAWMAEIFQEAIGELEQEPCEDAISRQAALDAISRIGLSKSGTDEVKPVTECLRAVEGLPPVTPQTKTGYWIESTNPKCS